MGKLDNTEDFYSVLEQSENFLLINNLFDVQEVTDTDIVLLLNTDFYVNNTELNLVFNENSLDSFISILVTGYNLSKNELENIFNTSNIVKIKLADNLDYLDEVESNDIPYKYSYNKTINKYVIITPHELDMEFLTDDYIEQIYMDLVESNLTQESVGIVNSVRYMDILNDLYTQVFGEDGKEVLDTQLSMYEGVMVGTETLSDFTEDMVEDIVYEFIDYLFDNEYPNIKEYYADSETKVQPFYIQEVCKLYEEYLDTYGIPAIDENNEDAILDFLDYVVSYTLLQDSIRKAKIIEKDYNNSNMNEVDEDFDGEEDFVEDNLYRTDYDEDDWSEEEYDESIEEQSLAKISFTVPNSVFDKIMYDVENGETFEDAFIKYLKESKGL